LLQICKRKTGIWQGVGESNKNGRFCYSSRFPSERVQLLVFLSSTVTGCGRALDQYESPKSLFGPDAQVLFTFLDISFREDPFSAAR
jgi:hypothetical protein